VTVYDTKWKTRDYACAFRFDDFLNAKFHSLSQSVSLIATHPNMLIIGVSINLLCSSRLMVFIFMTERPRSNCKAPIRH
jgi:hypothetical protein